MVNKPIIDPILLDENFLREHPGIEEVASFINHVAEGTIGQHRPYRLFESLGVGDIREYLALIKAGSKKAIRSYEAVRDLLGLSSL